LSAKETTMLADCDACATLGVKDLAQAREFYESTLGLKPIHEEGGELVTYRTGHTSINVYRSQYAGTNQATAVTWNVNDVAAIAKALREKGVSFEHYDSEGMTRDGDVHFGNGMKIAWFKDPSGNILNLVSA
jgi:catechol 2,3-dioxygenase-like lactoylglutathione lyase family enzyme